VAAAQPALMVLVVVQPNQTKEKRKGKERQQPP
jgi:hypothetical protein